MKYSRADKGSELNFLRLLQWYLSNAAETLFCTFLVTQVVRGMGLNMFFIYSCCPWLLFIHLSCIIPEIPEIFMLHHTEKIMNYN